MLTGAAAASSARTLLNWYNNLCDIDFVRRAVVRYVAAAPMADLAAIATAYRTYMSMSILCIVRNKN